MTSKTKEPQYERCLDLLKDRPLTSLGLMTNQVWHDDPKRLGFVLARYKFVAKIFSGLDRVLEVGCGDAFGTRVVLQEVNHVTACDFDPVFIEDIKRRTEPDWEFRCVVHDMVAAPLAEQFDAAYSIDVLEHIPRHQEQQFIGNIVKSLGPLGICCIGTPSIESQAYASPPSKEGHVNCKNAAELRQLMKAHFHHVFIFSMNDEIVHTGFYAMAHYLFALCTHRIQ